MFNYSSFSYRRYSLPSTTTSYFSAFRYNCVWMLKVSIVWTLPAVQTVTWSALITRRAATYCATIVDWSPGHNVGSKQLTSSLLSTPLPLTGSSPRLPPRHSQLTFVCCIHCDSQVRDPHPTSLVFQNDWLCSWTIDHADIITKTASGEQHSVQMIYIIDKMNRISHSLVASVFCARRTAVRWNAL